jgi:hypothetical protein
MPAVTYARLALAIVFGPLVRSPAETVRSQPEALLLDTVAVNSGAEASWPADDVP